MRELCGFSVNNETPAYNNFLRKKLKLPGHEGLADLATLKVAMDKESIRLAEESDRVFDENERVKSICVRAEEDKESEVELEMSDDECVTAFGLGRRMPGFKPGYGNLA